MTAVFMITVLPAVVGWVVVGPARSLAPPKEWVLDTSLHATDSMTVTLHIKLDDYTADRITETLMDVSTPSSPLYGKLLSDVEIANLINTPTEVIDAITSHFTSIHGGNVVSINAHRDTVTVSGTVASIETAFNTKLAAYSHPAMPELRVVRAIALVHLPELIAKHIHVISELHRFPTIRNRNNWRSGAPASSDGGKGTWTNDCSNAGCKGLITPKVIRTRYNIPAPNQDSLFDADAYLVSSARQLSGSRTNKMGVAEFQKFYWDEQSLQSFNDSCHVNCFPADVIGGNSPNDTAGTEAILDIEYIKAVAPHVPLTVWYNTGKFFVPCHPVALRAIKWLLKTSQFINANVTAWQNMIFSSL
jgi:subtilase family serine protease